MPTSRNQYRVIESFKDQVGLGKEYAKVRYKGIDKVGYISRVKGPGDTISERWYKRKKRKQPDQLYRVTIAANREYETNQIPLPGWKAWTVTFESTTYRKFDSKGQALDAGKEKLDNIADLASEEIKPINDVNAKAKPNAELSVEATEATGNYRPWTDAVLTVDFAGGGLDAADPFEYPIDVENEKIKWQ